MNEQSTMARVILHGFFDSHKILKIHRITVEIWQLTSYIWVWSYIWV